MDEARLIKAKEFYELTQGGTPKNKAAKQVGMALKTIENCPEYLAVISASSQVEKQELRKDIESIKRKQIKSYSTLLDKGEELMNEAKGIDQKILAQENQRKNLGTGVVEHAIAWDGENRNQDDLGDVMEGIIV